MKFGIVSDSSCDLSPQYTEQEQISIVSFYVSFDGEKYLKEGKDIAVTDFYQEMADNQGCYPKTSMPSVQDYIDAFLPLVKRGMPVLCICLTKKFSGSMQSAINAKEELMEDYPDRRIVVFDSLNASLGEGVSVYRAVELWKEGKTMDEVYDVLMEEREHVNVSFTVNDLNHLQRGGRVSKTTAVVGSLVNIKPILTVTSAGELKSDGTVRGRKKSLKTLVSRMEASLDLEHYGKDRLVCVLHGDCYDEAKSVADMVKELGFTNVIINDVSPSIGTHAGPGVVGLISYGKKR